LHEYDQASGDNVMSGRHRGHAAGSAVPCRVTRRRRYLLSLVRLC